jgi:hypothetical protein
MHYFFQYRRFFFKKKIKAIGHKFLPEHNRMDVFHEDGSITSIPRWNQCYLYLGTDWVLYTKKQMEKESGQQITLNVGN